MASMRASSSRASAFSAVDLVGHGLGAVEQVGIFEQVGLVGQDLLHAQRPLLVPGARQAQGLVPGRELDGAGAGVPGQGDRQHLEQDAVDVVLGLLLGQAQRVDLHAVAEQAVLLLGDAVALAADLVPQLDEGAHLAQLGDEADAGIDEEADPPDRLARSRPSGTWPPSRIASSTATAVASA